jgi:hypothetical protein
MYLCIMGKCCAAESGGLEVGLGLVTGLDSLMRLR